MSAGDPWEWDGKFTVGIPTDEGVYYFRLPTPSLGCLVATAPDLASSLEAVLGWLEGSDVFLESHGAHFAAVEARKVLTRAREGLPT